MLGAPGKTPRFWPRSETGRHMKDSSTTWRQGSQNTIETRYEGRQAIIAAAARACFERKGVAKTSIADITREVNITRELFYYYFPNKGAVVDAVMDLYVDEADGIISEVLNRSDGEAWEAQDALDVVLDGLCQWLGTGSDRRSMVEVLRETGRWPQIACRVAAQTVEALQDVGVARMSEDDAVSTTGLQASLIGAMTLKMVDGQISNNAISVQILPLIR